MNINKLFVKLNILKLRDSVKYNSYLCAFNAFNSKLPSTLNSLFIKYSPYGIGSLWYQVLMVSGPYGIRSLWYRVLMVSGPYGIRSLWYRVLVVSGPYGIGSLW